MGILSDAATAQADQLLTTNPVLGGGLLAVGLALLGMLLRVILRSDSRWERLNDAQGDALKIAITRLTSAEAKAETAERRALAAEGELASLRVEVLALRAQVDRLIKGQEGR